MRGVVAIGVLLVSMSPFDVWAQGTITGRVTDAAGVAAANAVLEVESPSTIEQRLTTSDAAGRYRFEDLRPGTYAVTAVRPGFKVLRIEGVEVSGSRTVLVDAPLTPGSSQEMVTLPHVGAHVDARSATRQMTIGDSVIRMIPNRRNYNSLIIVVPGVATDRDDVVVDPLTATFPMHGGRANEGRLLVDGSSVGSAPNGGSPAQYLVDIGNADEVVFTMSGGLGEVETSGVLMNVIPKQGGNTFRGLVSFAGNTAGMQGDNLTPDGTAVGLPRVRAPEEVWEIDGAVGGPIARDRVWYYVSGRRQNLKRPVAGLFANANAGNPATYLYASDLTRQVYSDRTWENIGARVTFLATQKHRFSVFVDEQAICRSCTGATSAAGVPDPSVSLEAQGVGDYKPQRVQQVSWTSPAADRLLFDARVSRSAYGWGNGERDGNDRSLVRVIGNPPFSGTTLTYRSQDWFDNDTSMSTWHASASFWVGAHRVKVGYQGLFASDDRTFRSNDHSVTYRLFNGIFNQITQVISPYTVLARLAQTSAYVQDQWTLGRATVQGAVRFDRARSWFPEQRISNRFLPSPVVIPETPGVDAYTDVTPRFGLAYDVTGDGRTAVKVSAGRYLEGAGTTGVYYESNPATRLSRMANRTWTDFNLNNVPNCVLENPLANGECGQLANTIPFGEPIPGSVDPALLRGSNVRPSDWNIGASVEHQILPRTSVDVGYFRRWFDGFTVVDNLLLNDADFQSITVTAPQHPNLPNGGGQTIGPLYIQSGVSMSRFNPVTMPADRYGTQTRRSDSFDVIVTSRTSFGLTVQGGSNTTRTSSNSCEIRAAVRESAPLNPYCDVSTGALTQFRGLAAYTIPNVDVQIGVVYQNKPGPPIVANTTTFTGIVVLPGVPSTVTVNLIEPGTLYGERISQLDVRATKVLRFGRTRLAAGIDLYNAFNSADVLTYGTNFFATPVFARVVLPTSIITPRLLRFTADVSF